MNELLERESEKLARCWMQHQRPWLRDYLVASVEDPRVNLPSILSRHFLLRVLFGAQYHALREQEYRFAAAMNWALDAVHRCSDATERGVLLDTMRNADSHTGKNTIPPWILRISSTLPTQADGATIPNYLELVLGANSSAMQPARLDEAGLNIFCNLWRETLAGAAAHTISVLEPACGSANDYRFLHHCGITRFLDYAGFDLCTANIENARELFPGVRFETGNVFEIAAPDKAFDLCIVHDLFEHLSLEGLHAAVGEVCRVTRQGLCVGFFQMDEIGDHIVRPIDDYHWNLLSMARMRKLFARHGFTAQVLHIGTFLRDYIGGGQTHNPNAYTFLLSALQ
jgi:SAM-dependent methyltransferase